MCTDSLPAVLVSPPWLSAPSPPELDLAPSEPRLSLPDAIGETWLARFPAHRGPSSEDLDDEVLDRFLDALDRRQPPREAEAARLSDGALVELLGEAGHRMSVKLAQYGLARLGEQAIAPVVAAARVESKLQPVLEFVFTPELALDRARELAEASLGPAGEATSEAYTAPPAERWLRAHAEHAVPVLLGSVFGDKASDRAAARKALSLLALSGVPVAQSAAAAGLPYAEQPRWMQYEPMPTLSAWLPALIAQPRRAAVEALVEEVATPALARNLARWRDAESPIGLDRFALWKFFDDWMKRHAEAAESALADPSYHPPASADPRRSLRVPEPRSARPAFWDLSTLPRPRLRDGEPLPDGAMEHLSTMLQYFVPEAPYEGLREAIDACEPASLDGFAAAALQAFADSELDHRDGWVVGAAVQLGGEATFEAYRSLLARVEERSGRTVSLDDAWKLSGELQRVRSWVRLYDKLGTPEGARRMAALRDDPDPRIRECVTRALAPVPLA